jgi:hypothetical protein
MMAIFDDSLLSSSFSLECALSFNVSLGLSSVVRSEGLGRVQDGSVASAAAQVAVKGLFDLLARCVWIIPQEGIERHHDTRRAEATLRTMVLRNATLDNMRRLD